ncbi:MAG: BMP family ABC transporter substrate-binding protein [Kiritimatiellae bacterium]|jgi:basic membrane protein A|nr:BMP family ABC transporter substrate-binding protein [Kiritimatiellia bacterium]NLD90544.1 BMP family ABC transporter substrate-binding protein [Lentisphaerota bacterium]HPC19684.1 BMP family ABC transporter substrate-binding protein [Kiritimatiellia bacterium]HQN79961.1 BMP family ABC transporter substrate-binding protein [Kiritimatiellia bacterium]
MIKHLAFILLTAGLACAISGPADAQPPKAAPPQPMRVAMLSDGGTFGDNSFNQNCREGIEELLYSGTPIFVQFVETLSPANFERKLAVFAERDYRLILGVGYRMAPAIQVVAAEYPRTLFACVDGDFDEIPHNVWALTFQVDECAFPAGYLAAAWADRQDPRDPAAAWIGGMDVDSVNQFVVGFQNGVLHFNQAKGKAVRITGGHVNSFEDYEAGKALATRYIQEGADVIFGAGSYSGNGAIAAAHEHGKWAIGVDTDQYHTLVDQQGVILTSCLKRMDRAVQKAVTAALDHQFWGGTRYVGNLANHGVGLAPFHDFDNQITAELKMELQNIQREILEGRISTGWPPPAQPPAP